MGLECLIKDQRNTTNLKQGRWATPDPIPPWEQSQARSEGERPASLFGGTLALRITIG